VEQFLDWIEEDIDEKLIRYEQKVLRDEFGEINFTQDLFEKI
jgi:hypothetical protein